MYVFHVQCCKYVNGCYVHNSVACGLLSHTVDLLRNVLCRLHLVLVSAVIVSIQLRFAVYSTVLLVTWDISAVGFSRYVMFICLILPCMSGSTYLQYTVCA